MCLTLCDPMDCSTPGFPVHHQLPELTQTHVHQVGDAIQPSHPLSSCLQSFPASGSFSMSQFLTLGGQSVRVSASLSVLPMNIQNWFPLGLTDLTPCYSRDSQKVFPASLFESIDSLALTLLYGPTLTLYMTTGKTIALTRWTFVGKVMSLLFNVLSRLVITSKEQASFNFMAAVTICSDFGAQK